MAEVKLFLSSLIVAWGLIGSPILMVYGPREFPWEKWFDQLPGIVLGALMGTIMSMPR